MSIIGEAGWEISGYGFTIDVWLNKGWGNRSKVIDKVKSLPFVKKPFFVDKKHSSSTHKLGNVDFHVESIVFPNTTIRDFVKNYCEQEMKYLNFRMKNIEIYDWERLK